jgi:hypothetical protein
VMYQPLPLNWMAGAESSLFTGPWPHLVQTVAGWSENFWMISNRNPHAAHSYSYKGIIVYSIAGPALSPSINWRCTGKVATPLRSTVSWNFLSEYLSPMCAL